jgi:hypothetical protein
MRIHPLPDDSRAIGHRPHRPLNRRWSILPNRTHLRRGVRMRGHILRIRHHRGQDGG